MDFLLFNFLLFTLLIFCAFVAFSQWRLSRERAILFYVAYLLGAFANYQPDFWKRLQERGFSTTHPDWPLSWDTPISYLNLGFYFLFFERVMGIREDSPRFAKMAVGAARAFFFTSGFQLVLQVVLGRSAAWHFHLYGQMLVAPLMILLTIYLFRRPLFFYQKLILAGVIALDLGFLGNILNHLFPKGYDVIYEAIICIPTKWGNFYWILLKTGVAIDVLCFSWALTLWQKKLLDEKARKVAPTIIQNIIAPMPAAMAEDSFFASLELVLAARFSDEKLTVGHLAQAIFKSEDVLLERLKREKGLTTEQFILRFRLDRSLEFLASTDRPMAEITSLIGLRDAAHFSRVFKNQFGLSPTDFRRKQRETA